MVKKEVTFVIFFLFDIIIIGVVILNVNSIYVLPNIHIFQESLDNITLFSIITIMSFFLFTPIALLMEGVKFTPGYLQSAVSINENQMLRCYLYGYIGFWKEPTSLY